MRSSRFHGNDFGVTYYDQPPLTITPPADFVGIVIIRLSMPRMDWLENIGEPDLQQWNRELYLERF